MKFSIKDWLSLFICLFFVGIGMLQPIHPWIGHALIIIGFLGIVSVLGSNIYRSKAKIFPSNLISWLFFKFRRNNPGLFRELTIAALQKHVNIAVSKSPFPSDIKNILLYNGSVFKYNLVVVLNETENSSIVGEWWDKEAVDIFEDYFDESYKNKPDRNYMNDWQTIVVKSIDDIPNDLIFKNDNWLLYKK